MIFRSKPAPRPLLACEIFSDRVLAARASVQRDLVEVHTARQLPAGAVTPSLTAANISDPAAVSVVEAGYNPGVVLPSTLAALGTVDAGRPTLVIKVGEQSTTVAIVDQHQLRLFRTLEVAPTDPAKLVDEVYPSLVFFEDQFGSSVERILLGGTGSARDLAPVIGSHTAAPIEDLVA